MRIVIALGGNALGDSLIEQKKNATLTAKKILPIILDGHEVVLTHGNGPQVGLINLAFTEGRKTNDKVCSMEFPECGAMSEGYIGYHLQNALQNELNTKNIDKTVVSIVTQVEVSKDDSAFNNPTKPIGSFYTKEEASKMPYKMIEDASRGYRRVVPSPKPVRVVEEKPIKSLIENGFIVISCGGGGIPVIKEDNKYIGVDAVIDKDYASSKLAVDINADMFLILTTLDNAKINFKKENEESLYNVKRSEMEKYNAEGHFLSGSMKPKVEACINYLKEIKDGTAIITSIENAVNAVKGISGTIIKN